MRPFAAAVIALLATAVAASPAWGHSALVEAMPAPGQRLDDLPRQVTLSFTEPLDARLTRAVLRDVGTGSTVSGTTSAVSSGKRLVLRLRQPLARGAYRLSWHTVSTVDGHALEGSFSFGVRAPAAGAAHEVEQSPLARQGWMRVLARGAMYAALLIFAGGLCLDLLLRRGSWPWLVPAALAADMPASVHERAARRYRRVMLDAGFVATGAAAASALADAVDASGRLSAPAIADFLLANFAGLNRIYVVVLLALAVVGTVMRVRMAALAALAALVAVALSGHANASSPRGVALLNDWVHLVSTALWLGGIALLVLVWGPALRRSPRPDRLAVARHVLPRFGRVAGPAFAVVLATGAVSAFIELGRLSALWQTDYGRVLAIKVGVVALIAAASFVHALRLRPRLLDAGAGPDDRLERRHWRLLRIEPLLGAAVVAAVALLVAFPLPPRQLGGADDAQAATASACRRCPLPNPAAGELAVAAQGGSDVVAAWLRRTPSGVTGTVRLYGLSGSPAADRFTVVGARQRACGRGCARFSLSAAPRALSVTVRQRGRAYTASLPTRWRAGAERRARQLVQRAQTVMRGLRSVREIERVSSIPETSARTAYRLRAPNRMSFRTDLGVESVAVGADQWTRTGVGAPWRRDRFGGGLPFRLRSWFTWTTYARHAYLLDERRRDGRRTADIALMDRGTPAWWRLTVDTDSGRVLADRMVTYGHFMTQRFFAFDKPVTIRPPEDSRGR